MRTARFALVFVLVTAALGCSKRESSSSGSSGSSVPRAATSSEAPRGTEVPRNRGTDHDAAIDWLKTTKGFHFVLDDAGMHAEGDMVRPAIGAERVRMTMGGVEWLAAASVRGVTWYRRDGGQWTQTDEPENGGRMYQRVTVAFNPQKKEGSAQHMGGDLYRFTNANTGEVHNVRVSDGRITEIAIGDTMKLVITKPDAPADVPVPK